MLDLRHASASGGRIIEGDFLEVAASLPDRSFDVAICDPPYNIGKDFGNQSDRQEEGEYLAWCDRWIEECRRLITADGLIYIYGFTEWLARIAARQPVDQQRWMVWCYRNRVSPVSKFWQRSHESILCLWRGVRRPSLQIDQIRQPYVRTNPGEERRDTPGRFTGRTRERQIYRSHPGGRLPMDIIEVPVLSAGAGERERWFLCRSHGGSVYPPGEIRKHDKCDVLKHPTQKPMGVTRVLLRSVIEGTGQRVLIPFCGSGSECVAARRLGIEYTACEINPEYIALARGWLEAGTSGSLLSLAC